MMHKTSNAVQPMAGVGARRRGFSLLDLLVSIAVIATLMGIMLPVLSHVKEATRRVTCRSNVRQMGLGLALYAEDHRDRLPASVYSAVPEWGAFLPQEMTTLHVDFDSEEQWDGLGHLFSGEYLPAPEIFYCPSHRGMHPYSAYESEWASRTGIILGNYHLRALAPTDNFLHGVSGRTALVADGMREAADMNHLGGCNLLRADMSVEWFVDRLNVLATLVPAVSMAPDSDIRVARAWWTLETGSSVDFPAPPWGPPVNPNGRPNGARIP